MSFPAIPQKLLRGIDRRQCSPALLKLLELCPGLFCRTAVESKSSTVLANSLPLLRELVGVNVGRGIDRGSSRGVGISPVTVEPPTFSTFLDLFLPNQLPHLTPHLLAQSHFHHLVFLWLNQPLRNVKPSCNSRTAHNCGSPPSGASPSRLKIRPLCCDTACNSARYCRSWQANSGKYLSWYRWRTSDSLICSRGDSAC